MTEQPTAYPGYGNYGTTTPQPDNTRPTRRPLAWNGGTDIGLLLLRIGIGGAVFAHGAQKVFGLWGGPGITSFAGNLETFGYQQSVTLSWVTGVTELVAGAFLVIGLFTPLAAAAVLAIMINATLLKLGNGFFVTGPKGSDAFEYSAVLGLGAACLVFTGPGRVALDNGRAWHRRPASWGVLALVIGVAAAVLVYVLLRRPV
jgi:putative oxidoreductase